jgi:ubiquinol-cytochrome c reductase cytochrome c1 subunit
MLMRIFASELMQSKVSCCAFRQFAARILPVTMVVLASLMLTAPAFAAGGGVHLEHANNDVGNIGSLQRGARNYVNYCMGCHSAKYVRYNRLAQDLQITEDQLVNNLMFLGGKPHDTMQIAMPQEDATRWFGAPPPDLSLIARSRGPDYVYSFLKSFYLDDSRSTGVNNLVLDGAAMPHVLWELQGAQQAVFEEEVHEDGSTESVFTGFEIVSPGTMSPDDYDEFVRDLVNFLEYIGEPVQLERRQLGIWVLLFLLVFGLFAYALKNEIWKDVK